MQTATAKSISLVARPHQIRSSSQSCVAEWQSIFGVQSFSFQEATEQIPPDLLGLVCSSDAHLTALHTFLTAGLVLDGVCTVSMHT